MDGKAEAACDRVVEGHVHFSTGRDEDKGRLPRRSEQGKRSKQDTRIAVLQTHLDQTIPRSRRLSREADSARLSKSQFLANMSHEIRTPMNGIIGVCDLIGETTLNAKQIEYINIIRSSARSLLHLINDILDFAKIEAGKLAFENIPFSVASLMHDVADLFLDDISKKDLELVVDVAPTVPDNLIGDPLRLRQILINLISNAIKFTERGTIVLNVRRRMTIGQTVRLLFSVRDTGIGIDPAIHDRLFDAFTQADGSTTRKYGGTGLGLAICRRLVKLMGGRLSVASAPGRGSTFSFTTRLGVTSSPGSESAPLPQAIPDKTIILLEGNRAVRQVLVRQLRSMGLRIEVARNRQSLTDRCLNPERQASVDLLLLGSIPDGSDPLSLIQSLRTGLRSQSPQIIMLSRSARQKERQRALAVGVDACLPKPVRQTALRQAILNLERPDHARPMDRLQPAEAIRPAAPSRPSRLPGLDIDKGLRESGGSWHGYHGALICFCDGYRQFAEQIRILWQQRDFCAVSQRAGELKGDAARIAAPRLYEAARALEVDCTRHREGQIPRRFSRVEGALRQVLASAERLAQAERMAIDENWIRPAARKPISQYLFKELEASLAEFDPVKSSLCLQWVKCGAGQTGWATEIDQIEQHIQHYDFEAARLTLHRLIQEKPCQKE